MTKTLVSCSPASDRHIFRDQLHHSDRDRAARTRRRKERAETRRQADQAALERVEDRRTHAALQAMAGVVAKWAGTEIDIHNEDRASWELGQAGREAGLSHAERTKLKEALIGPKCPSCLSRLCQHTPQECERRLWEAECAEYSDPSWERLAASGRSWEYDWSRDTR